MGVVLLIAPDMKQAKVLLDYAEGTLQSTPMLRQLIEQRTRDTLVLTTGITLEVRSASFRRICSWCAGHSLQGTGCEQFQTAHYIHIRLIAIYDDGSEDVFAVDEETLRQGHPAWARIIAGEWQRDGFIKPGKIVGLRWPPEFMQN